MNICLFALICKPQVRYPVTLTLAVAPTVAVSSRWSEQSHLRQTLRTSSESTDFQSISSVNCTVNIHTCAQTRHCSQSPTLREVTCVSTFTHTHLNSHRCARLRCADSSVGRLSKSPTAAPPSDALPSPSWRDAEWCPPS